MIVKLESKVEQDDGTTRIYHYDTVKREVVGYETQ